MEVSLVKLQGYKSNVPGSQPRDPPPLLHSFFSLETFLIPLSSISIRRHTLHHNYVVSPRRLFLPKTDHDPPQESTKMDVDEKSTTDQLGKASALRLESVFTPTLPILEHTTRITVVLGSGESFIVPFIINKLVYDLHSESVRRANALGFHCTIDNSVLRIKDHDGPMVYTGDRVCDVLPAGDSAFYFGPLNRPDADVADSSTLPGRQPHIPYSSDYPAKRQKTAGVGTDVKTEAKDEIEVAETKSYIRWITPERALDHDQIDDISVDLDRVTNAITISDLAKLAYKRLYPLRASANAAPQPATVAELFLEECHLSADASVPVTLEDLGLHGTLSRPINIFVILRNAKNLADVKDSPHKAWWFETSNRGIATFCTSLRRLCSQISSKKLILDDTLQVLWEITHFPPAVVALRQLFDGGYERGSKPEPLPLTVLAACLREVAVRIAPPWIAPTPHTALEVSRQLFAWIHSSVLAKSLEADHGSKLACIVHKVQLKNVLPLPATRAATVFKNDEIVLIKGSNPIALMDASAPVIGPILNKVLVSKERRDSVDSKLLALAMMGDYGNIHNLYFSLPTNDKKVIDHKRMSCPGPEDFDKLLLETNKLDAFKMIGPLRLASSQPPVVTLDEDGYVSVYDMFDAGCGDRYSLIWNAINGTVKLDKADPGHMLLQKLQHVIEARKKEGFWEVDAWDENGGVGDSRPPKEAIVICVDQSGSMGTEMPSSWLPEGTTSGLSNDEFVRLSEVKEIFQNLVARMAAYKLPTYLGLVTFNNCATASQGLTPVLYDFKDRLMNVEAGGMTSLWDAIEMSRLMLVSFKTRYPEVKCRIITLTDGQDNHSNTNPWELSDRLCQDDIVMDTIVIGTELTDHVFKVAKHTGGYTFLPKSRSALFQIFLLETFVDIAARPDIVKMPLPPTLPGSNRMLEFYASEAKVPDMADPFDIPPCRPHPNQGDMFFALKDAGRYFANLSSRASESGVSVSGVSGRTLNSYAASSSGPGLLVSPTRRTIMNEIRYMIDRPHDFIDVYVSEKNMGVWKVVMKGPPESAYETGTFVLLIEIDESFPRKPPVARFITPILHPNITKHGRICHPIFDREWDTNFRVYDVLIQVYGILMSLEVRDAVDPLFTLKVWTDREAGKREVATYIAKFATESREVHRFEIAGAPSSSIASTPSIGSSGILVPSSAQSVTSQIDSGTITPSESGSDFTVVSSTSGARSRRAELRSSRRNFFESLRGGQHP